MKRSDLFPERYFNVERFGGPREYTISGIRLETVSNFGSSKEKPALEFRETNTVWLLSMTAFDSLAKDLGTDDASAWIGTKVRLFVDQLSIPGKGDVSMLRAVPVEPAAFEGGEEEGEWSGRRLMTASRRY